MSVTLSQLIWELDSYLEVVKFNDYGPNGLQVEGKPSVTKIISGVTASQALINKAIELKADAILVHHGYFWSGENPCILGMKRNRLKSLLANDISLIAYHLPLDAHPVVGNNVQLAERLGITIDTNLDPDNPSVIGLKGHLAKAISAQEFANHVEQVLKRKPQVIDSGKPIHSIGWCSGGGQKYIDQAIAAGVDLFLTGEASEQTFHSAKENGISFIAAGHHATERYGVQALGNYIATAYDIEHIFQEIDNPF